MGQLSFPTANRDVWTTQGTDSQSEWNGSRRHRCGLTRSRGDRFPTGRGPTLPERSLSDSRRTPAIRADARGRRRRPKRTGPRSKLREGHPSPTNREDGSERVLSKDVERLQGDRPVPRSR